MAVMLLDESDVKTFYPFQGGMEVCTPLADKEKKMCSELLDIQNSNIKRIFASKLASKEIHQLSKSVELGRDIEVKIFNITVEESVKEALYEASRQLTDFDYDEVEINNDTLSP